MTDMLPDNNRLNNIKNACRSIYESVSQQPESCFSSSAEKKWILEKLDSIPQIRGTEEIQVGVVEN
jgi:hypothetical protein